MKSWRKFMRWYSIVCPVSFLIVYLIFSRHSYSSFTVGKTFTYTPRNLPGKKSQSLKSNETIYTHPTDHKVSVLKREASQGSGSILEETLKIGIFWNHGNLTLQVRRTDNLRNWQRGLVIQGVEDSSQPPSVKIFALGWIYWKKQCGRVFTGADWFYVRWRISSFFCCMHNWFWESQLFSTAKVPSRNKWTKLWRDKRDRWMATLWEILEASTTVRYLWYWNPKSMGLSSKSTRNSWLQAVFIWSQW